MGRLLDWLEARAPRQSAARLLYGSIVALLVPLGWAYLARSVERFAPWPLQALALKPTFAGHALFEASCRVQTELEHQQLVAARAELRSLVSRSTASLDDSLVAAAAIESLAENLVDSWLSPLLLYSAFGLTGAYAYRAINTADAMWGYRTPRYELLGKASARLDDVVNFIPARIGAVVLCCVAGRRVGKALATWCADGGRTTSPNAGQTMAVTAGALGLRLAKPGHYVLNAAGSVPDVGSIARARALVARAMLVSAGLALFAGLVRRD
jgi:adenosylcobinamide-phosphate synthase